VSLEHTLFLDFLNLFVNMRLAVSFAEKKKTHFLDLRIKSYGCLKFQGEVWAWWACAATNDHLVKILHHMQSKVCCPCRAEWRKKFL
jgi:hypothetical protein